MSKKDKSQFVELDPTQNAEVAEADVTVTETDAEKLEKFKAAKKAAAQRHAEKVKADKAARVEKAQKLIEVLKSSGDWDKLPEDMKAFVTGLTTTAVAGGSTESTFTKIFGAAPTVGQSVTLMDVFQKTLKGKSNIDHQIKIWAEKGIIVSFKEDKENVFNSVYTIEQM